MKTKTQTSKEYFNMITSIYVALIVMQLIFGVIAYLYIMTGGSLTEGQEMRKTLIYVVPLLVIAGFSGGNIFMKSKLDKMKIKSRLVEKMPEYRAATIIRYAMLEFPFFFSIVAYVLTKDLLFLGFGAIIILIFLTIRPTRERAIQDLELNQKEQDKINDPNVTIAELKVKG
jgi:hypothetical protein